MCQRPRLKIAGSQDALMLMEGSSRPVVEAVSTELTLRRQRRKSQMLKPRFKPRVTVRAFMYDDPNIRHEPTKKRVAKSDQPEKKVINLG